MIKNYLKIALRNLKRDKVYSFIKISGLAVGIACFLLILFYINNELSYDEFHKNKENIYRVFRIEDEPLGRVSSAATPNALPEALINDFPDLNNVVSIISRSKDEITSGENKFQENILFASPNFFDMFDFPLAVGNYKQLEENINSILLTKKLAAKLFGNESPLGKTVTVHGQFPFIVAGILEDIPSNSNFQFDAFVSKEVMYKYILPGEEDKWYSMGVETFVEVSPGMSPGNLKALLPAFLNKYLPDYLRGRMELHLQPLKDIHTNTDIISFIFPSVSRFSLILFFIIACTILGIASINFINLATAGYSVREKEIGIRKVVGAKRTQLISQFLSESILMTLLAAAVGYALLQIILPYFNNYIQQPLSFSLFSQASFFVFAVIFAVILGLINGLYPSFFFSRNIPAVFLRKERKTIFGRISLRHILVTIQFAITIALIFAVISINNQISFMENHNLGFHSENLIAVSTNTNPTMNPDSKTISLFTDIIQNEGQNHGIVSAAFSENIPGSYFPNRFSVIPGGGTDNDKKEMVITRNVNEDFINTFKMQIISGRNFSQSMSTDYKQAAIINETAAEMLGWKYPVGKHFHFAHDDHEFTVIGVIDDINFRSLQNKIEPLVIIQGWGMKNFITARIQPGNFKNSIAYLQKEWTKLMPEFPFEYSFIKDLYRESYKKEEQLLKAISTFAMLAIILASLGLAGLTALTTVQRTKEIGIRKTLGASVTNVVFLMSKDLIFWIISANIIAQPVAFYFMNRWLQGFAYRISLEWWIYVLAAGTALSIGLITVSFHAIKAALVNPVKALRYE